MVQIKNLIFDFDGTIADTAPLIIKTMQATMRVMKLPLKDNNECRAVIGLKLVDIPSVLWPDIPGIGNEFDKTYRSIFDELKHPLEVTCFPKVTKTIKSLYEKGYSMAVATSRNHKSLIEFLRLFGILDYFSILIGADDVVNGKPAPDPALAILGAMEWKGSETLVIGDSEVDMLMGKAAGTKTCGVTYGYGILSDLQATNPDFIIPDFNSLNKIL